MSEDFDPNRLREVEIKRLAELAEIAYKNAMDLELKIGTRESWYQKYTNAVLALNQLLKDLQYKDYEKRLRLIEESWKRPRRMVLSCAEIERWIASANRKNGSGRHGRASTRARSA